MVCVHDWSVLKRLWSSWSVELFSFKSNFKKKKKKEEEYAGRLEYYILGSNSWSAWDLTTKEGFNHGVIASALKRTSCREYTSNSSPRGPLQQQMFRSWPLNSMIVVPCCNCWGKLEFWCEFVFKLGWERWWCVRMVQL